MLHKATLKAQYQVNCQLVLLKCHNAILHDDLIHCFLMSVCLQSPFPPSEHYLLLPEIKIPVVAYGDEPSSIIAHALASQEYEKQLEVVKKRLKDFVKECLASQR